MVTRRNLNYRPTTIVGLCAMGACASAIVGIYSTQSALSVVSFVWIVLALVGVAFSWLAIRQGRLDIAYLRKAGISEESKGTDLSTLVFKKAHVRSMVVYANAHLTLLQVGVVGVYLAWKFPGVMLSQWFRVYSTASLIFALYQLSLNLVLDSTVHARMAAAEETEREEA